MHSSKIRTTSMWLMCIALLVASTVSADSLIGASSSSPVDNVSIAVWPGDDGYVDFGQTPQWMFEIPDWMFCDGAPTFGGGDCTECEPVQCQTPADCCASCQSTVPTLAACKHGLCVFAC